MNLNLNKNETGAISGSTIAIAGLILLVLGFGAFSIWAFMSYREAQSDVESKVAVAAAEVRKEEQDKYVIKLEEDRKEPNREFVAPDNYGNLRFMYPKTWSAHVARDGSTGNRYEAYLHRDVVGPIGNKEQFMLRVLIEEVEYDRVVSRYDSLVRRGDLRSSSVSFNGHNGTRLDGNFTRDIRGSSVIFRIRDKTATLRADADTYKNDFDALIQTIDFNA